MTHLDLAAIRTTWRWCLAAVVLMSCPSCSGQDSAERPAVVPQAIRVETYSGMCDASGAVALDETTFLVADDEGNTLRVYRSDRSSGPIRLLPWDAHLGINPETDGNAEADIEAAAVLDGTIYWITSHGRSKKGKWRANRHRFFAMRATKTDGRVVAEPIGKPYEQLIVDLVADETMRGLGLAEALALGNKTEEDLAPKKRGINIEGLAAGADGKSLLIGLRNPRPGGMALVVPLLNPAAVVRTGAKPQFGNPVRLPLAVRYQGKTVSLGIRSIEYSPRHTAYLIVAGPHDPGGAFALFRWSGRPNERPALLPNATTAIHRAERFSPEALIVYPGNDRVQLLSDDGSMPVRIGSKTVEQKELDKDEDKTFRGLWVEVE